jgi:hypothetical protein
LETGSLTVELTPLKPLITDFVIVDSQPTIKNQKSSINNLFNFFMRRVLAATVAELFELQPFRGRLPVLGGRIIALFAITAL